MEDFALLNSNIADPTLIGTLRGPGAENQPATDNQANTTTETFGNNGTDVVEFSEESLQLSRLANNEQAQQAAAGIPESDLSNDEDPNTNTNLTTSPFEISNNGEPFNLGDLNTGVAALDNQLGTSPAEAATAQATGPGGSVDVGPPGFEPGITQDATGELESTAFATETELQTSSVENSPVTAAQNTANNQAAGIFNDQQLEPEVDTDEIPANVQDQANQIRDLNNSLNNINGQPSDSPVTDVDRAQQPAQFQEQLLLQNVGTQLAQTIPPATVVSVLG